MWGQEGPQIGPTALALTEPPLHLYSGCKGPVLPSSLFFSPLLSSFLSPGKWFQPRILETLRAAWGREIFLWELRISGT